MLRLLPFLNEHCASGKPPFFGLLDGNLIVVLEVRKEGDLAELVHHRFAVGHLCCGSQIVPAIDCTSSMVTEPPSTAAATHLIEPLCTSLGDKKNAWDVRFEETGITFEGPIPREPAFVIKSAPNKVKPRSCVPGTTERKTAFRNAADVSAAPRSQRDL